MGASGAKTFQRLIDLKRAGQIGPGSRMLELGAQNICQCTGERVREFISEFHEEPCTIGAGELERIADGGTMAAMMKLCGVSYLALDIYESEDCMLFDLNNDSVPDRLRGQFDLVTNLGTSEHVLDQCRVFGTMHEFTKPGGLIYHDVPMGGYLYHGFFSYTPLFFNYLAMANDYEILFKHFSKVAISAPFTDAASEELLQAGYPDPGYHDAGIEFIFRKTVDAPFRIPVEGDTTRPLDHAFVESKGRDGVIVNQEKA